MGDDKKYFIGASSQKWKGQESSKNGGPTLMLPNIYSLSFQPPSGQMQTLVVRLQNDTAKAIAYSVLTNRANFYAVRPSKGVIDDRTTVKIEFDLASRFTAQKYEKDQKGHEFHILAVEWPKMENELDLAKFKAATTNSKEVQRLVLEVDFKGNGGENQGQGAEKGDQSTICKTSEELSRGPKLVSVCPGTVVVSPPVQMAAEFTVVNESKGRVAFKIQTNRTAFYAVKPTKTVLEPNSLGKIKLTINPRAKLVDIMNDLAKFPHQLLIIAFQWVSEGDFDVSLFTNEQKTNASGMQTLCVDVELQANKDRFVTITPPTLSFKEPDGINAQSISIDVKAVQNSVAFKIAPMISSMYKYYKLSEDCGVIPSKGGVASIEFTLKNTFLTSDLPSDPKLHCFKLQAAEFSGTSFDEEKWEKVLANNLADVQKGTISIDFCGKHGEKSNAKGKKKKDKSKSAVSAQNWNPQLNTGQNMAYQNSGAYGGYGGMAYPGYNQYQQPGSYNYSLMSMNPSMIMWINNPTKSAHGQD